MPEKVLIEIATTADVTGAVRTRRAMEDIGKSAEEDKLRLQEVNAELRKLQSGPSFGGGYAAGTPAPGAQLEYLPGSGQQIADLLRERTALHRALGVQRRVAQPPPLPPEPEMDTAMQIRKLGTLAAASGLPGSGRLAGGLAAGMNIGPQAAGFAAAAAAAGLTAEAIRAISEALTKGIGQAVEFSDQLRTLPSDKAQELRDRLGPVADLLEQNSDAIALYAKHSKDAENATENFWIALSARAIPSLNEFNQSVGTPKLDELGAKLGNVVGGGAHVAASALEGVNVVLDKTKISSDATVESFLKWSFPGISGLATILAGVGDAAADAAAKEQAAQKQITDAGNERKAREKIAAEIAQSRTDALEASLPTEQRIETVRKRQAELIEKGAKGDTKSQKEAAALEKTLVALDAKKKSEDEAAAKQAEALALTKAETDQQIRLNEAINAGNKAEEDRIRAAMAYDQTYKATNDPELASRAWAAEKKSLEASRAKEAEQQAKRDQDAADQKAAGDERAKRAGEILAKKREEMDLETRINEARATGNKEEEEKLRWLQLYNRILAERGPEGNPIFSEDEARRAANAAAASAAGSATPAYVPPGTKPGEIFTGTNRRRGASESDAFGESALNLAPGESLLDQYKANQARAVGAVNGQSILPADPLSSLAPQTAIAGAGQPGAQPGGGGSDKLAKAAEDFRSGGADIRSVGGTLNAGLEKLAEAASGTKDELTGLKTELKAAVVKIDALAAKI